MRLVSGVVRSCRLHRDLSVEFNPSRTLIGGPNECGKSTLVEAIHRALFLKAKGTTEYHRALQSRLHGGHPEVELVFDAHGKRYTLKKRFSGSGTTTLTESGGSTLSGDAAEAELARILGVEIVSGKALAAQWSHLWVCQGQAGEDPSQHARAQHDGLLQRLQDIGGAAAIQSELDTRVATRFRERHDAVFTKNGNAKAGSELEVAEREAERAGEELERARNRLENAESAADAFEKGTDKLQAAAASLVELEKEWKEFEARDVRLRGLQKQEVEERRDTREAKNRHDALEKADQHILSMRGEISRRETSLTPAAEEIARLEKRMSDAKRVMDESEAEHRKAANAVHPARLSRELAMARLVLLEKEEDVKKLAKLNDRASAARETLVQLQKDLAALPEVDKKRLRKIQSLATEASNAQVALQAMAAGFEVIASNLPVEVEGRKVGVHESQILTEETTVSIGPDIRLRIQPGGGTNLAEARRNQEESARQLREALEALGVATEREVVEISGRRDDIAGRTAAGKAALDAMEAEGSEEKLSAAQAGLASVQGSVERLLAIAPPADAPADENAAKTALKDTGKILAEAEENERAKKIARDTALAGYQALSEEFGKRTQEASEQHKGLDALKAQLDYLLTQHGSDEARRGELIKSAAEMTRQDEILQKTIGEIAGLQPDLIDADRKRISGSIEKLTGERNGASTAIAVAQAALRSDGDDDPQSAFAMAEAGARLTGARLELARRRAGAIRLLDELFQAEQQVLSNQFTKPLAEKVSGYLQCIFGPGARAEVDLGEDRFEKLRVVRPGFGEGAYEFDELSGGAREQTAAAMRLAIAEVLASNYDGCLPIAFDDAFAYSDPARVRQMQRMLYLGASRGLQIIVLTCNPADYASLGADTVTIDPQQTPLP